MQSGSSNPPAPAMRPRVSHSPPTLASPTGTTRDEGIFVDDDDDARHVPEEHSKEDDAPDGQVARYKTPRSRHRRTKPLSSTTEEDIHDTIHIKPEQTSPKTVSNSPKTSTSTPNTASNNKKKHPRTDDSPAPPEPKRFRTSTPAYHRSKLPPLSPLQMKMDVDINDIDIPGRGTGRSRVKVPPTERRRISVACDSCRHRKIKCRFKSIHSPSPLSH